MSNYSASEADAKDAFANTSAGHRKFIFKSAVRKSTTKFQFSKSATASLHLYV